MTRLITTAEKKAMVKAFTAIRSFGDGKFDDIKKVKFRDLARYGALRALFDDELDKILGPARQILEETGADEAQPIGSMVKAAALAGNPTARKLMKSGLLETTCEDFPDWLNHLRYWPFDPDNPPERTAA